MANPPPAGGNPAQPGANPPQQNPPLAYNTGVQFTAWAVGCLSDGPGSECFGAGSHYESLSGRAGSCNAEDQPEVDSNGRSVDQPGAGSTCCSTCRRKR